MRRFRLLLSLLLGLALLVHGAGLPAPQAAKPAPAAAMSAMPCAGMDVVELPCQDACCAAKPCVDQAGCAFAQPMLSSAPMSFVAREAEVFSAAQVSSSPPSRPPSSLLRPPIDFHG